jgi:hypothetical protein
MNDARGMLQLLLSVLAGAHCQVFAAAWVERIQRTFTLHVLLCLADRAAPNDAPCCQVIEPTVIAALNMYYPCAKLAVHVLDDGRMEDTSEMVGRLRAQCRQVSDESWRCRQAMLALPVASRENTHACWQSITLCRLHPRH